ncbi:hypothetical protein [uncultured Formosa sp.]|uniref:hypothetical protein n=1 Tax=uncultured Formosa sp. TaxID=255435 RepID=UPI0026273357|nr:hypothetical protein [uncultured Formosa sp.]
MNYNKLLFFVIVLCFGAFSLNAQSNDFNKTDQIPLEIKDTPLFQSNTFLLKEKKTLKIVNRHSDLINTIVNSKIKCTLNFFTIIRDVAAC